MSNDVQLSPCPAVADTSSVRPDRSPVAEVLNATNQITTTALITAMEPKLPPYRGD